MAAIVTTLDELEADPPDHLLVLYSGGVDSTFLLAWLGERGIRADAVVVRIGDHGTDDVGSRGRALGVPVHEVDATDEFFAEFVPAAIHADAWFQGRFPVSSTLTRPLMARTAVRVARELGCDAIGHTATYMQNTALRLGRSLLTLAGDLDLVAPFLGSDVPREMKLAALAERGLSFNTGILSIDANPWARVIECGSLESPENVLDESVFTWTRHPDDCPEAVRVELRFEAGLPVAIDQQALGLGDVVARLNRLGGMHGIGRHSGLEDTAFGVKNHEVREAPAATVLTEAHRALVNAVAPMDEHALRSTIAQEWTNSVVHGGWFGTTASSLRRCLADLDEPVTGDVLVRLDRGRVTVLRTSSPHGLYASRLGPPFHAAMRAYSYAPWLFTQTLTQRVRTSEEPHDDHHRRPDSPRGGRDDDLPRAAGARDRRPPVP